MQASVKSLIKEYTEKSKSQVVHARLSEELFKEASRIREKEKVTWTNIIEAGIRLYVLESGGHLDRK